MATPNPSHADLTTVIGALDEFLLATPVKDYGPNGLQVFSGRETVHRIATGVTANLAFIEKAVQWGADLAVVHHGIYWNGAPVTVTGALGRRIRALIEGKLSLAAYHLPLDAHSEVGNASCLAQALGFGAELRTPAFEHRGLPVGCVIDVPQGMTAQTLLERVHTTVNPQALGFLHGPARVSRIGIVTGGAARDVSRAAAMRCDAFITGEAGEYSQADAREEGIHFIAGGHHRTERYGPMALAEWLDARLPSVAIEFIDIDNPV